MIIKLFPIRNYLNKIAIKQLLKLVFYSSSIAIAISIISTVFLAKLSFDSQNKLIDRVIKIELIINDLNNSITDLIRRTTNIALSESINQITSVSNRKELDKTISSNLINLKEFLKETAENSALIYDFNILYKKFIAVDNEHFEKQKMLIILNEKLYIKSIALEIYVQNITAAIEAAVGKIKLKASRARLKKSAKHIRKKINANKTYSLPSKDLQQQRRIEMASQQVDLSAIQIVQLSRKLSQINNRDALISIRDNEIAQEISQIRISLNILTADLVEFPELMEDVVSVRNSMNSLIKIMIEDDFSIYNLRTQYLDLKSSLNLHLNSDVYKITDSLVEMINKLENHANNIITLNKVHINANAKVNSSIIILLSILVVIFITLSLRTLKYRIDKPLQLISSAVDSLSKGELTSRLNSKDFARDEFWLVANSYNQFAERNEQLINELSSTHDELLENQHRLHAILENALVGIAHLKDRRFISVNNKFEEMFGYARNDIEGLQTELLFSSTEDFETLGEEAYDNLNKNNTYYSEWLVQHKNGSEFWCAISAKSIEDGKPEFGTIWLYEDITERKQTEKQLLKLANYDVLTGLPNRSLFMDRLENHIQLAKRNNEILSIMFIDLDRFKQVNDSLGHEVGDKLLKLVAQKLNHCVRSSDTVARLGGDEFIIMMINIKNKITPERIAKNIIADLKEPTFINSFEINISASIGISMYPNDGINTADMIRNADAAMYHSKKLGRNRYQFYIDEMNSESLNKLEFESRLRRGIENNNFELYFQKQINVKENKVIGYEALIRWRDESGKIVPPNQFIPILEETGLIVDVGEWVISEAFRCTKILAKNNPDSIKMAINLSVHQFQNKNLLQHIEKFLNEYKIKPNDIELEITETVLMTRTKFNQTILNNLHDMGCRIVLDDFGTGYSSLAYLKQFPIDTIKIDRSFIRDLLSDPSDAAICNAILAMANSLNIEVVTEGVETKEQLDYLIDHGFTIIQGYYYGRPEPLENLLSEDTTNKIKLT